MYFCFVEEIFSVETSWRNECNIICRKVVKTINKRQVTVKLQLISTPDLLNSSFGWFYCFITSAFKFI